MKEIKTLSPGRLNNGAHFLFMTNILARAEADAKVKAKAATPIAALKEALAKEDNSLKLSQKSLLTDDIAAADSQRDALYSGYKRAVQGFLNLPVENLAKAAKTLNQHIKDYDIDPDMQLDKETGMLMNFLADLEGKHAAEVAALSLTPFVTNLKEANERVRTLTAERTEERMTLTVGALKAARRASDEAYRQLVKLVNALALVEGETDYSSFIDYANTEITHYKREVIGQKADAPQTSGSGDNPPVTPPDEGDDEEEEAPDPEA